MNDGLLSSEEIQMLISSMTAQGTRSISPIEIERFLNAVARVQSNVPTGMVQPSNQPFNGRTKEQQ